MNAVLRTLAGAAIAIAAPGAAYGQDEAGEGTFKAIEELLESHEKAFEDRNAPPPPEALEDDPALGLPVGAKAPDFTIATHRWRKGVMSPHDAGTLYERLAEKTVLLVFTPTIWDPHAFDMFHNLIAEEKAMTGTGLSVIVVAPNPLAEVAEFRASRRVALEMVHDPEGEIFAAYNLPVEMDRFPRHRAYFIIGADGAILDRDPLWHYVAEHEALMDRVRTGAAQRAGFETYREFAAANPDNKELQEDWRTVDFRRRDREAREKQKADKEARYARVAEAEAKRDEYRAERAQKAEKPAAANMDILPDFAFPVITYSYGKPSFAQSTLDELCDDYLAVLVFAPALDFKNLNHFIAQFTPDVPRMQNNRARLVIVFPGTQAQATEYREVLKADVHILPDPERKVMAAYGVDFDAPQTYPRHPGEYPLWVLGPGRKNFYANPWFHAKKDMPHIDAAFEAARARPANTPAP